MMDRQKRFVIYSILTTIYAVAIFVLSSMPSITVPQQFYDIPHPDKFSHTLLYFGLGVLLCHMLHNADNPKVSKRAVELSLLVGTVYGILDEVHQGFVPGRVASFWDAVFNFLGVIIAVVAFSIWIRWKPKKSDSQ
ncbi:MAG: VanZ family protein [Thermoplasmata archaeon]|nr:VanZ family protein [Thermoplasmata archaeon]